MYKQYDIVVNKSKSLAFLILSFVGRNGRFICYNTITITNTLYPRCNGIVRNIWFEEEDDDGFRVLQHNRIENNICRRIQKKKKK